MRRALTGALVITALAAAPAAASDAPVGGTTTLELEGSAAATLRGQSARLSTLRPAVSSGVTAALPVRRARIGRTALLDHGGSVRLRARRRTLTLQDVRVDLGAQPSLSARVAGTRLTLGWVRLQRWPLDAQARTVDVASARVVLTRLGAATLRRRLGLRRTPRGQLFRLAVSAKPGGTLSAPAATSTTTGPASPQPVSAEITSEPPVLARPATAVDIASATVGWRVRESFIQYIASGEGTRVSGGAVAGRPTTTESNDAPLVYDFAFPFASGWYDPPTGTAAVYSGGTVNFSYAARRIDLNTSAPEVELNGGASRTIMRFSGSGGTDLGNKRTVLVNLNPAGAASTSVSADGRTRTFEKIPATIPEGTNDSVFAGFYFPGDPFGSWSVSFTTA